MHIATQEKLWTVPSNVTNDRYRWLRQNGLVTAGLLVLLISTGCQAVLSPISGVPASRLPSEFLATPKNDLRPINISRLRQEPPREYLLDTGDTLGIFIEGVLGEVDAMPPFQMPESGERTLPPAIGFPVPVREDGTLPLPLVPAINVRGLTLTQVENVIRQAYTIDQQILRPGRDRIFVTLMRERTYKVVVLRQEGTGATAGMRGLGAGAFGIDPTFARIGSQTIELPAYQNDVLRALTATGGLPDETAKNEVLILRGGLADARRYDEFVRHFYHCPPSDPCLCFPPLPDDPSVLRIPLRLPPGEVPTFNPEDIILRDGDVVMLESREAEVFFTGGMLGGGVFPLPRDRDLDVLEAISMVSGRNMQFGGGRGQGGNIFGSMGGGGGSPSGVPPGQLFILRRTPCDGQITIAVDLTQAIRDPQARPLVQSGDILVLQQKPIEEVVNFGIFTFFTFGIRELFR